MFCADGGKPFGRTTESEGWSAGTDGEVAGGLFGLGCGVCGSVTRLSECLRQVIAYLSEAVLQAEVRRVRRIVLG